MQSRTLVISAVVVIGALILLRPKHQAPTSTPTADTPSSAENSPTETYEQSDVPQGTNLATPNYSGQSSGEHESAAGPGNFKSDSPEAFNSALDAATAEAAANPENARSNALTAKRAAKLKKVRAQRAALSEN